MEAIYRCLSETALCFCVYLLQVGSAFGGMDTFEKQTLNLENKGPSKASDDVPPPGPCHRAAEKLPAFLSVCDA